MHIGIFMMPLHPPGRNYLDTLAEDRAAVLLADELGFSEAYVGEHATDVAENITSCLLFLASLAHDTRRIVLGSGTLNLPNTHPVQIASQVAMLDHLLRGRFIMGISPGGLMSDAEAFGNYGKDRNAMFVECIDTVLKIWASEPPYDIIGQFWQVSTRQNMILDIGQGRIIRPYQQPQPRVVGTVVAPYSKGISAMGERGWLPISANFLLPQWVATHWPNYAAGCLRRGARANSADWRVARSIFVADDTTTAQRYARSAEGPYHFYYKQLIRKLVTGHGRGNLFKPDEAMPDSAVTPEYACDRLVIAGTVNEVVEQILALREQIGDFGTLLYAGHDWVDPTLARRSMVLMAEQVMPRINAALGH